MRRGLIPCAAAAVVVSLATSSVANADDLDWINTEAATDPEDGTLKPRVGGTNIKSEDVDVARGARRRPRCTWTPLPDGFGVGDGTNGQSREPAARPGESGIERLYLVECEGGGSDLRYLADVDPAELREAAYDSVRKQLPLPELDVAPGGGAGLIRVQNWLAVEPAPDVTATAAVGPVWVTMTASQRSLTWDMGNGDTVECDGTGTPLPAGTDDLADDDVNGKAGCGYTYEHVSAPQFGANADLAYENSVTSSWSISWVDHTGASGTLAALERTTDWTFQVRQIQTVRVSG